MSVRLVIAAAVVPADRQLDRGAGSACGAPCVGGRRVQLIPAVVTGTEAELVEQFRAAGLKPGGDLVHGKRSWTQDVPLGRFEIRGDVAFSFSDASGAHALRQQVGFRQPWRFVLSLLSCTSAQMPEFTKALLRRSRRP